MSVYAKLKRKQKDGTVVEEDRCWTECEREAGIALFVKDGFGINLSHDTNEAFNNFIKNREVILSANSIDNLIAIKFYDEGNEVSAEWNGGWLYLP